MDLQSRIFLITVSLLSVSECCVGQNDTAPGCGVGLDPAYHYLCDRRSAWGIIVQTLAALGFLCSTGLVLALLLWLVCVCGPCGRRRAMGGAAASTLMFLLAVMGVFALPYSFVITLSERTCPVRVFLFGVLFGLAFGCLLVRSLALLGWAVLRSWGEPTAALALALVQAVIAGEWLLVILVRDAQPCSYSQGEFVVLLVYIMLLLVVAMVLSLHYLCRVCTTYSYSSTGWTRRRKRLQGTLLFLTLLLSGTVWVVWVVLFMHGNKAMGRRPDWDDPVLSIALTANGWVLLLGQGLIQVRFLFCCQPATKNQRMDFTGWISPSTGLTLHNHKNGTNNKGYQHEAQDGRGKRVEPVLRSPHEASFSMTEIEPDKIYSIPRPQTTNINEPYDDYYRQS